MKRLSLLLYVLCIISCKQSNKTVSFDASIDYKKGASLVDINSDSAFYYFNKSVNSSNDSLQTAVAYTYMAIIQSDNGDYFGAQENLLNSLRYLNRQKGNARYILSNYNELGNTNLELKNYQSALYYYDQTLILNTDDNFRTVIQNNKAIVYQKLLQYENAIDIYRSLMDDSKLDRKEYARILSNMARTKWLQNPSYNALPDLWRALQIRKEENDYRGLNASYSHLSDYYTHSHSDSALIYANEMYSIVKQINNPDNELEALQKLITLAISTDVKKYFIRYQYLNDSLQTARNNAKNQFALIRYEAAKSKADNLALQKENAEKRLQIILQRAAIVGVFVLALMAFIWYRKRKQKILHEQQLETSKKVHDIVANGIYRVISGVEHSDLINRESLLNQLEMVYKQSRNISYEITEPEVIVFRELISRLIKSFSSTQISVSIVGNTDKIWRHITPSVQREIEYILQELMVNMKKHSAAQNVVVKFEDLDSQIGIQYTDDGIGLSADFQYGNGLANTENRIASIGGRIIFDKSIAQGLKVLILIPTV